MNTYAVWVGEYLRYLVGNGGDARVLRPGKFNGVKECRLRLSRFADGGRSFDLDMTLRRSLERLRCFFCSDLLLWLELVLLCLDSTIRVLDFDLLWPRDLDFVRVCDLDLLRSWRDFLLLLCLSGDLDLVRLWLDLLLCLDSLPWRDRLLWRRSLCLWFFFRLADTFESLSSPSSCFRLPPLSLWSSASEPFLKDWL